MMEWLMQPEFWMALAQIIAIDILLGGDNAVVIALACRHLPEPQRRRAIFGGVAGAIVLRILLLFFALQLLALPFLKLAGALMLLWIGIKLLQPEPEEAHEVAAGAGFFSAIKTIVIADAVMSLDNVLAVAGAAGGNLLLVSLGVLISIPIIVWGSQFVLRLLDRYPQVVLLGGGLLGWIAGGMLVTDVALASWLPESAWVHPLASVTGATLVIAGGLLLNRRQRLAGASRPEVHS
ncbi:TerC family protein [Metapseudomonas furukawaii]|uniref:TerC family protein n=1 Tax=Metapseudomonas furukawaii TaxID=1149133 RepID=UPI00227B4D3A|nr:TerC family protein [Pseudomonas furukawaii]WAG81777.1 TerC family protein [Pseudomonas furukawaii]